MKPDQGIPTSSFMVPIHLLLVEDNPGDARLVYEMLRNQFYIKLEVADCLAACMIRLDQGGIDLVLLDLGLGDSQGLDTFTSVVHTHPALPVVALTGLDDDALALRTVQAGGQDYLTKNTVTPEILRRTIRHAFERKQAELQIKAALEALKGSEENFRRSLEDSPLGVRVATTKGETIYANKVLLDIYGYANVEEMNKIPLKERYTSKSYAEFHIRKKAREEGNPEPNEYEINIVRKNGEIRHLQVNRKEILWNGTKQFQVIYQDITERKLGEDALRESEEKWRSLVNILPDYISLIDREGRFLFLNHYSEGFTEKDVIGSSVYKYLSPESKEIFEKKIAECQNTGKIQGFEYTAMGNHGIMREYENYLVPILEKNKVTNIMVVARDITERKLAEESIRSSLAEKEVLLKEVHHRVKNNLMTIIGLIKMQAMKADNEMLNPLLLELESRIRSMALVHENLYKSADLAHVNLQNYIETMSAQIRVQFGADRDIRFSVQAAKVDVSLDIAVPCGLILNELLTNAFKHAFPGDKPRAGAGNCEIKVIMDQEDGTLMLTVADNGIGLHSEVNWKNPETIGLQLIKMLSQQLNGSIELDRSAGTVFRLKFPMVVP